MDGFLGRILRVNLTTGEMGEDRLPEDYTRDFIGGSGLAARYLWDEPGLESVRRHGIVRLHESGSAGCGRCVSVHFVLHSAQPAITPATSPNPSEPITHGITCCLTSART